MSDRATRRTAAMDLLFHAIGVKLNVDLGDTREAVHELRCLVAKAARLRELLLADLAAQSEAPGPPSPEQRQRRREVVARSDVRRRQRLATPDVSAAPDVGPSA